MSDSRYMPHFHKDDLGLVRRDGERAICPGCGKVVRGVVHVGWQSSWWRTVAWPASRYWRRRLMKARRSE
jgi:hypothetical protein